MRRSATPRLVESLTGIETIKTQAAESGDAVALGAGQQPVLSTLNVRMRELSSTAMYTTATLTAAGDRCA
jgi:ATP-binding cassette subfamily C protein LapB